MCSCKYASALFHTPVLVTGLTFHCNTPDSLNLPTFSCYSGAAFLLQDTATHKLSLQEDLTETEKWFDLQKKKKKSELYELVMRGVTGGKQSNAAVRAIIQCSVRSLC